MVENLALRSLFERPRLHSPVLELRQYRLHPGRREELIRLFDSHFIESQEAVGMAVIGQFRDLDWPDRFVWLRGFQDMAVRRAALAAFYEGPVWAEHRDAANATMVDSDDVLLLRPAWPGAAFDLAGKVRETRCKMASFAIVAATIFNVTAETETEFATLMIEEAEPLLSLHGGPLIAAFVTEHAENTFPRLPVRAEENVFVIFQSFADALALASHEAALAEDPAWTCGVLPALKHHFTRPSERLRLAPTARSLL